MRRALIVRVMGLIALATTTSCATGTEHRAAREFHGDYIWCVQPDADEEDVAVRFRIEKGGDK